MLKWVPLVDVMLKESRAHALIKRACEERTNGLVSLFIYRADLRILGAGLSRTPAITRATARYDIDPRSLFLFGQSSSPVHTRQV